MSTYPLVKFAFEVDWGGTKVGFQEVSGLNVEEAATIAALPYAPNIFAKHPDLLTKRREYLLSKLDKSF